MTITPEEIHTMRHMMEQCEKPLFLFDDDPDGLSSFLLLYRWLKKGKGCIVKSSPEVKEGYTKSVNEYNPDLIVILDKPMVSQEFIDQVQRPIIWIDHHQPQNRTNVHYYNPRKENDKDNRPTNYWCWQIVKEQRPEDIWIAMAGCIGDWFLPEFTDMFQEEHPTLLQHKPKRVEDALFNEDIGKITRLFSFIQKGKTSEALKAIKVLTRIKTPEEILEQTTSEGNYLWKKMMKINEEYEQLLSEAQENVDISEFLIFKYTEKQTSFTSDLSNELLYRHPEKIILICRNKSGEMKCSVRSTKHALPERINKAMVGLQGYGGGHTHACGACVKEEQFEEFLERFKESFK